MSASVGTLRTVVWDIGAVMLRWQPTELVRDTICRRHPELDAEALTAVIFSHGIWGELDSGRIERDELAARAAAATGVDVADVQELLDGISPHLVELPGSRDLVGQVRAAGHRVVFLSNMPRMLTTEICARLDGVFDDGVFSCDVGWAKPDAELYRAAEERLALDLRRTLFLDDNRGNVQAARAQGWAAEVFTGPHAARALLAARGWL
jgi:putative hydrolase of the HAD superfamily